MVVKGLRAVTHLLCLSMHDRHLLLQVKLSVVDTILESHLLKHVTQKKCGTQDALRAYKALLPFLVPFDFKTRTPKMEINSSLSQSIQDNMSN